MSDIVVTVPKRLWKEWIEEGDLPGEEARWESHFWLAGRAFPPIIKPGERVYVVAHGKLRGYAPLVRVEPVCTLRPAVSCLVRAGGAVAVTIPEPVCGFRGWHYRWWNRSDEQPFPDWMTP